MKNGWWSVKKTVRRSRFVTAEYTIIAAGIVALALVISFRVGQAAGAIGRVDASARPDYAFATDLAARYGPTRNSKDLEEWLVRDFFQDERGGVFVDVGANHHQVNSNTYFLETALGWSGVAIEPQARFAAGYAQFRPLTAFVPLFVSDVSHSEAVLYVPKSPAHHLGRVASMSREFTAQYDNDIAPTPTTTTTLDDALDQLRVARVDFLSMDIELAEPKALAGFSIDRFRPRLVCVEAHAGVRQQILDYFHQHNYVVVGQYLGVDNDNYWFVPLGTAPAERSMVHTHE
jgi:FkbM family methyltransferase